MPDSAAASLVTWLWARLMAKLNRFSPLPTAACARPRDVTAAESAVTALAALPDDEMSTVAPVPSVLDVMTGPPWLLVPVPLEIPWMTPALDVPVGVVPRDSVKLGALLTKRMPSAPLD